MKNYYLRTSIALACAFGLVACGGSDNDLVLRISSISGLTMAGATVTNNGGTPEAVDHTQSFFDFKDRIGSDSNYDVQVKDHPANAKCEIINGKGKTATWSPNNIMMRCTPTPHKVTAVVSGVADGSVVVVNGSTQYTIPVKTVGSRFDFPDQVGDGVAYGYVVLTQPTGQTCTIPNGGGVMGSTDVTIDIICK